ncbi:MAG: hypothetical protein ACRD1A_01105 [Terriglobales bacterium]
MRPPPNSAPEPESNPGAGERSADGVDLTLIRWMLSLTPAERLGFVERRAAAITDIRARHGSR